MSVRTIRSRRDAARDACELVALSYDLFGVGENLIPFTAGKQISPDAIRALSR